MVRRNVVFLCGIAFFFGSLVVMLKQLDRQQGQEIVARDDQESLSELNARFINLENELKENKRTMVKLQSGLDDLVELSRVANAKVPNRKELVENILQKEDGKKNPSLHFPGVGFNFSSEQFPACQDLNYFGANCDIEMNDEYGGFNWKDVNGGVWKQGFDIQTNDAEWEGKKLKIHLVPHSHNDPGWLKTYEDYFRSETRHILDNIVDYLGLDKRRRFIWAEMSYLSMWYDIADDGRKQKLKELIKSGQLEIVTGGWVMNDEANTHYFAMIDQMIEGHEWLARTFGVIPRTGWAIDPFGHTPTMAFLLKRMGLTNMLIQRVHYIVKRNFAEQKKLEFRWRQQWDGGSSTDINCHMMPFYSYDVPHTCGPDPKICCQFDFGRLPGMRRTCPWGVQPKKITKDNVAERAKMLLDQYRKKSKLFATDTLLVILGDDFRYQKMDEVEGQFTNYATLFDYINSHPELNAEAKFSTLSEYFDAMLHDVGGSQNLPSLSGDFFTYADRQDHYWSGYYTSRPFYKTQERNLEAHLRGAEILFSLALPVARESGIDPSFSNKLYPLLQYARQNLGLFQHHDGITGTSKDPVVKDYGRKLQNSVMKAKEVMSRSAELLLLRDPTSFKSEKDLTLDYDSILASHDKIGDKVVINIDKTSGTPSTIVIYNSLSYDRTGLVRLIVTAPHVKVTDHKNQLIPSQTNLIWIEPTATKLDQFELVFVATVAATGLATYQISFQNIPQNSLSKVDLLNVQEANNLHFCDDFTVTTKPSVTEEFSIENEELIASFSTKNGLLRSVTTKRDKNKMKVAIDFGVYEARGGKERSGAYLFLPSGPASPHLTDSARPIVRIVEGPLLKEVHVLAPNVEHIVSLQITDKLGAAPFGIFVTNKVDIRNGMDNKELSMRITAPDVANDENSFFTDLNGFQMQKRKTRLDKIPIQANFYPMPTMAFIQNEKARLTVLTGQPRGVASLVSSQLEIILDRRLMQDDNRGMGQATKDNLATSDNFVILIERWSNTPGVPDSSSDNHFPSIIAHHSLLELLHPMWSMQYRNIEHNEVTTTYKDSYLPLAGSKQSADEPPLPCSVHIVNLRSIESKEVEGTPTDESALIVQKFGHECHLDTCRLYKSSCLASDSEDFLNLATFYPATNIVSTSLSLQYTEDEIPPDGDWKIEPMEIKTFKIRLK
uniref:alpha-mannosidase 2-like n=2 Tax=Styela clava TaxID=7725 RepID=UPI00193995ED|nr:alpha-mannosidase 2-like [Styela clava]